MDPAQDNITFRQYRTATEGSDSSTDNFEKTMRSPPSDSHHGTDTNNDLLLQIKELKEDLVCTKRIIENIRLENQQLKCDLENYKSTVESFKNRNLLDSSLIKTSTRKRKRPKITKDDLHLSCRVSNSDDDTIAKVTLPDLTKEKEKEKQSILLKELDSDTDTVGHLNVSNSETITHYVAPAAPTSENKNKTRTASTVPKKSDAPKKYIHIIGGNQCTGLASKLTETRQNTTYDKYSISANTHPEAPTDILLQSLNKININEQDKIVMCVGEEDTDPFKLVFNLQSALLNCKASAVIILSVRENKYLNEHNLNHMLKSACKHIKNCHFLQINNAHYGRKQYDVYKLCKTLNILIDELDYKSKYLNFNAKKADKIGKNERTPKVGTIPYYFMKINKSAEQNHTAEVIKTVSVGTQTEELNIPPQTNSTLSFLENQ